MAEITYPPVARNRGIAFWLRPSNWWAARRKFFRPDHSVDWRDSFETPEMRTSPRSTPLSMLHRRGAGQGFRFLILGDTGEGDRSQYGLLPLIRALRPDFMIINGDVAYPAGNWEDFVASFFEPYRDLQVPIWAVPGNHEYYSEDNGRTFFELFCTDRMASVWEDYGIPFVRQPGTYWELKGDGSQPLVIIGVDSLKAANLDGDGSKRRDDRQLEWLEWRLALADSERRKAIVLFHIPALVDECHADGTRLTELHRVIAKHSCVRLVVCGHEHNYQRYEPETFLKYLHNQHFAYTAPGFQPLYLVSGGGGAYLASTAFEPGDYRAKCVYPSREDWADYVQWGRKIVDRIGVEKWAIGRITARVSKGAEVDADAARFLSMILVEVQRNGTTTVSPVFLDDLKKLYDHLPAHAVADIRTTPPDPEAVKACIRSGCAYTL